MWAKIKQFTLDCLKRLLKSFPISLKNIRFASYTRRIFLNK